MCVVPWYNRYWYLVAEEITDHIETEALVLLIVLGEMGEGIALLKVDPMEELTEYHVPLI